MVSPILTSQSRIPNASDWSIDCFALMFFCQNHLWSNQNGILDLKMVKRCAKELLQYSIFLLRQIFELSETNLINYFGFWIIEMVRFSNQKYIRKHPFYILNIVRHSVQSSCRVAWGKSPKNSQYFSN